MDGERLRPLLAMIGLALAACGGRSPADQPVPLPASADTGTAAVDGPTLIGYFPRPTRAAERDSVRLASRRSFQGGIAGVRGSFEQAGIRVYEMYTDTLLVRDESGRLQIFVPPPGDGIGYYLAAPGREPEILHGLRSEEELRDAAWRYFHAKGGYRKAAARPHPGGPSCTRASPRWPRYTTSTPTCFSTASRA